MNMEPVEQTDTAIYFVVYQITGKAGEGVIPRKVWNADTEEDGAKFIWSDLPEVGARRMLAGGSLEGLLAEGAMDKTISELRERLIEDGLLLREIDSAN